MPFPTDLAFYKTYHDNEVWKRFSKQMYIDAFERVSQKHPKRIQRSSTLNEQKQPMIVIGAS